MTDSTNPLPLVSVLISSYNHADFVEASINANARPVASTDTVPAATQWCVQWQQPLYLGDLQWPWPDQPPGTLLFAFSPDTGLAHKDSYRAPEDMA